ncbi:MAG: adenine phosphoribosyltransferase [Actinobacteria bacterium]|uniref:adenine phosphoribosyltransferase n=1 Tax=freshwater metagenome TaxID=449393 RepID=A0A6J5YWI7_9ZZZZ|nr:adenine phosphoribosyltransferase [Actinomycetota bacterium]
MALGPEHFRTVPDWPKEGIQFHDISPILRDAQLLASTTQDLIAATRAIVGEVDYVTAPEARGFLFGPALAVALGAGFVLARKPDKLPPQTASVPYELEYGEEHLHIHDHELEGKRVLVHDDLLATGGTARALVSLMETAGAEVVGAAFVSEILFLEGRASLGAMPVATLVEFD